MANPFIENLKQASQDVLRQAIQKSQDSLSNVQKRLDAEQAHQANLDDLTEAAIASSSFAEFCRCKAVVVAFASARMLGRLKTPARAIPFDEHERVLIAKDPPSPAPAPEKSPDA